MARELRLDVSSRSDGTGLDESAVGVDRLRRETNRLGDEFKRAEREAASLDRQLLETRAATAALAREFSKVGADPALKSQLAESRKATAELQRLRTDVIGDSERDAKRAGQAFAKAFDTLKGKNKDEGFFGFFGDAATLGEKAGFEAGGGFMGAFGGVVKGLPPEAQAGLVGGIAGAVTLGAPVIASAVSAAVLLGVGGAGIAAGIALAVKDPQVQAAFGELGQHAIVHLEEDAKPFRAELVATAGIFSNAFDDVEPDLKATFAELAKDVQPLARGLAGLVKESLPGLKEAAKAAGPLFKTLADEGPKIGRAMSDFFSAVADAGPAANVTLKFILVNIEALIEASAELVREAAPIIEVYGAFDKLMFGSGEHAATFAGKLDDTASSFSDLSSFAFTAGKAVHEADRQVELFTLDLGKLLDNQLGAREAAIGFEQAMSDLKDSFKKGSDALDITTQKGRDNLSLVDSLIGAAKDKLQADLAAGDGSKAAADKASAAYYAELQRIRDTLSALGIKQAKIDELIGQAALIPKNIAIDISLVGVQKALGQLGSLGSAIERVASSVSISVSHPHRAAGGTVVAGQPYVVGEYRPELFVPNVSGHVVPHIPPQISTGGWARGSASGGPPKLSINMHSTLVEQAFAAIFMKLLDTGQIQIRSR